MKIASETPEVPANERPSLINVSTHDYVLRLLDNLSIAAPNSTILVDKIRRLWCDRTREIESLKRVADQRKRGRSLSVEKYMKLHATVFTMRMAFIKTSGQLFHQELVRLQELQKKGALRISEDQIGADRVRRIAFLCLCDTIHRVSGVNIEFLFRGGSAIRGEASRDELETLNVLMNSNVGADT